MEKEVRRGRRLGARLGGGGGSRQPSGSSLAGGGSKSRWVCVAGGELRGVWEGGAKRQGMGCNFYNM